MKMGTSVTFRRQLLAPVEVVVSKNLHTPLDSKDMGPEGFPSPSSNYIPDQGNNFFISKNSSDAIGDEWICERLLNGKPVPVFTEEDFESKESSVFITTSQSSPADTPTEMFERFFTEDIFDYITKESNNYALFRNFDNPNITKEEIKCFFGLMIYSGYNHVPSMHLYWDSQADMHNDLVSNVMRRNRMYTIKKFIHFADNGKIDSNDKIWKLLLSMNKIRDRCIENLKA